MGNFYRSFGLLMAFPFQVITTGLLAHWGGTLLDKHYPKTFSWTLITYGLAFILIINFFIMLILYVIKIGNQEKKEK